jgi:hypothetical protein
VFDYRTADDTTLNNITAVLSFGQAETSGTWTDFVTIDHNTLYGSRYYSTYLLLTNTAGQSSVTNNAILNDSVDFSGVQYPPTAYSTLPPGGYPKFVASNNTLNGAPVTFPGQQ